MSGVAPEAVTERRRALEKAIGGDVTGAPRQEDGLFPSALLDGATVGVTEHLRHRRPVTPPEGRGIGAQHRAIQEVNGRRNFHARLPRNSRRVRADATWLSSRVASARATSLPSDVRR